MIYLSEDWAENYDFLYVWMGGVPKNMVSPA